MTSHPLAADAAQWLTEAHADRLGRAQQIGEALDAQVAAALGSTDPAVITAAVRALGATEVVEFTSSVPGPAWPRYYEQQRRALHQHATDLFGAAGRHVAAPLEYLPLP